MTDRDAIGLFGGTFDPPHTGHLILAERAADALGLSRILFVPTANPPHKETGALSPFDDRLEMTEAAIGGNGRFELSLLEDGPEPSFTWKTLERFAGEGYDRERLHLLVGGDSLAEIASWRRPETICRLATIVAMARPGWPETPVLPEDAAVVILETGTNAISSSAIRRLVAAGRSIRYLVPAPVERYIAEHGLYREPGKGKRP
ncbi:MAG: nicotinate (nicotinamide) nucleotide adenylyltransferase [Candidatus Krumholzibacteriota bacterium]|nr:nicotinate (nicotinamide) nucleotide adenylyltransferase [Candidatus Krumholzibacteriota bacterium]